MDENENVTLKTFVILFVNREKKERRERKDRRKIHVIMTMRGPERTKRETQKNYLSHLTLSRLVSASHMFFYARPS